MANAERGVDSRRELRADLVLVEIDDELGTEQTCDAQTNKQNASRRGLVFEIQLAPPQESK